MQYSLSQDSVFASVGVHLLNGEASLRRFQEELGIRQTDHPFWSQEKGKTQQIWQDGRLHLLIQLGEKPRWEEVMRTVRRQIHDAMALLGDVVSLELQNLDLDTMPAGWAEALGNGLAWSAYTIREEKGKAKNPHWHIRQPESGIDESALRSGITVAAVQAQLCDLVNAPANKKTPAYLADRARASAERCGYTCQVLDVAALTEKKMDALLAVGRGSMHDPCCIILEYRPRNAKASIGIVGKGITFDTGGISIKASANMHMMKSDMAGAGAVLAAMEIAASLALPVSLTAVVPCAENAVDARSYRPGDVIMTHIGKSVEVIDTDAEGRLILADGLGYLTTHYEVDTLIDLATLTGNCIAALGYEAAGLFSASEGLVQALRQAGDRCGEQVWQLPLWDAYKEDLQSDIADLRNFSGKPFAGAITAAKFLEEFTGGHKNWAHLDIAGVAFRETEFGKMRNATAWGAQLLLEYFRMRSEQ